MPRACAFIAATISFFEPRRKTPEANFDVRNGIELSLFQNGTSKSRSPELLRALMDTGTNLNGRGSRSESASTGDGARRAAAIVRKLLDTGKDTGIRDNAGVALFYLNPEGGSLSNTAIRWALNR